MSIVKLGTFSDAPAEAVIPKWWRTVDHWTLAAVLILIALGILFSFAASPPLAEKNGIEAFHYVNKHVAYCSVSLAAMLVVSMLSTDAVRRLGCILFLAAFLAIMLLPVFGTDFGKGATRWFSIGIGSVQPSEFLKPGLIVLTAWLISGARSEAGSHGLLLTLIITGIAVAFLVNQPDFGQAALVIFGWGVVYFASGAPILLLVLLGLVCAAAGYLAYAFSEHFQKRIDEFIDSLLGVDSKQNTQLDFATDAIREGGVFGTGAGEGTVKWFLPDAHTDLIVAVAAEEFGLVMIWLIVALFAFICCRSISRLMRQRDLFIRMAGLGLVATFGMQAFINLAVAVRLVPPKGITLPLISYGGSSMLAMGVLLGILLAFTRDREHRQLITTKFSIISG